MLIFALDDEEALLAMLTDAIKEALPEAEVMGFSRSSTTLKRMDEEKLRPDVAFLDIEMPGMSGLEMAKCIKERSPNTNIVFVTGFSQYALEAYALRPSGYVMKPASKEKILAELENLRRPPERTVPGKRIRVQCFGDFEIFVDGEPVPFARAKSKELLAYLVDRRGANCSSAKIADALWEDGAYDRSRQKQLSVIRNGMLKALRQVGAEEMIKKTADFIAVDPDKFDCDYYMAMAGDVVSVNSFMGEYMAAYSWAEYTSAAISMAFGAR